MSGVAPAPSESLLHQQRAFLLFQLANSPDGRLPQSDANKAIAKQIKDELKLAPAALKSLRQTMVQAGWLTEEKSGRVVTNAITEVGKQQLRDLERCLPLLPAGGKLNLPESDHARVERETYILSALAQAPKHRISKADLEMGFGGKGKPKVAELIANHPHLAMFRDQHCLGLNPATTRAVLAELASRGDVQIHRADGSEAYTLTQTGVERLAQLRNECPVLPPTGKPAPTSDADVRASREAFLLLNLMEAPGYRLSATRSQALSYPKPPKNTSKADHAKPLKLNHATAWQVRGELVRAGRLAVAWDGEEGWYTLTPAGKQYLTTLPFDHLGEVKIRGAVLTELLTAAREAAKHSTGTAAEPKAPATALVGAQLEAAVMQIFNELLAGPYANLRMVPIHEIRKTVAQRLGQDAASHSVFDECVLELRRSRKMHLVPLDNRSQATPNQIELSISAVGQTFFYAENAHAHV